MWYILFSILTISAILVEKSNSDKKLYLILSTLFPTIAYSLWRVHSKSETDTHFIPIYRMCFWFSVMNTLMCVVWAIVDFISYGFNSQSLITISLVWSSVLGISTLITKIFTIERAKLIKE